MLDQLIECICLIPTTIIIGFLIFRKEILEALDDIREWWNR